MTPDRLIVNPLGWSTSSRRSISWLLYLSDDDVRGGELRSFPQRLPQLGKCGAHEGDLQVGWLRSEDVSVTPVFLDCWRRTVTPRGVEPRSALYTVVGPSSRRYITPDFDLRDPITGTPLDIDYASLTRDEGTFYLIEDQRLWAKGGDPLGSIRTDISPRAGTLVLFDSVALPHEVLPVTRGKRIALAGEVCLSDNKCFTRTGWFHEKQQEFPSWAFT